MILVRARGPRIRKKQEVQKIRKTQRGQRIRNARKENIWMRNKSNRGSNHRMKEIGGIRQKDQID